MANVINATSTGNGGLITTGDDSGVLNIQTNETTAVSINASQNATFTNPVNLPNTFGFKNRLINGAMTIWQRGTSFTPTTSSTTYTADRWSCFRSAYTSGITVSQVSGLTISGVGVRQYALRLQRDSGNTSTANLSATQSLESNTTYDLAGKSVTLSFWARVGSNFSAPGIAVILQSGTGTDENIRGGFTGYAEVASQTMSSTSTSFVQYSITGTVPSNSTQLGVVIGFNPTGTAGTNDYIDITGVQLEVGTALTSFDWRPYGTELALCQRYYYKSCEIGVIPGSAVSSGLMRGAVNSSLTRCTLSFSMPVTMRAIPTCAVYNPNSGASGSIRNEDAGTNLTATIYGSYTNCITQIDINSSIAGNSVVGYATASAEL